MNEKSKRAHEANRLRILAERAVLGAKLQLAPAPKPKFRIASAVGQATAPAIETVERACVRCEKPFRSGGAWNRMCVRCRRVASGAFE